MAETVLDSLVVRIAADTRELDAGLAQTTTALRDLQTFSQRSERLTLDLGAAAGGLSDQLGSAAERASDRMAGAFARMARNGRLSFEGLRDAALAAVAEIIASLLTVSIRNFTGSLFSSIFLPGRAGGGAVSPRSAYVVGERGPEVFIPHTSGRIDNSIPGGDRVAPRTAHITINMQGGGDAEAVRQSAAQVALAVRRALARADRSS